MLDIQNHDNEIRELRLARPPVNALNPEMVETLLEAVGRHRPTVPGPWCSRAVRACSRPGSMCRSC